MFSKSIVESDSFMDMPCSAQSLYLHLGMAADDWGFINNPRAVRRMCGASEDDLRLLASKKFILEFPSGAAVIKAWWINNYVPADRRHATRYQEELAMCYIDENKSYTLRDTGVRPADMFTSPKPVYNLYTEDRLGKDRLGEGSNSSRVDTQPDPERIPASAGPGGGGAAAGAVLGVIGYRIGRQKGDEADRLWQEVVNDLAANEQQVNPIHVESSIHGLIDTLDVFDEEKAADAADAPTGESNE